MWKNMHIYLLVTRKTGGKITFLLKKL